MAFNGAGTFQLVAGNPVVTGTVISSTWANNTLNDIAANGLSNCIAKDGQTTPTGNIPLGGFRITGMADAVNLQDAVNARQVQNGGLITLSAVSGTDTITAVASPTPAAYVAGQRFQFVAAGANTTTSVTLNISGLGAKNITKSVNAALAAGDIQSGAMISVVYDGTQFQMSAETAGKLINVQTFTASGTYTPTPGMRYVIFEVQGAGGGGGGAGGAAAGNVSIGAPGGSGSYARGKFTSASIGASQAVTVGTAGTAASNSAGGNGGSSSVGALITAPGGIGGSLSNNVTPLQVNGNGVFSTAPSGANIYGSRGIGGTLSVGYSASVGGAGNGGSSVFGTGAAGPGLNSAGLNAVNFGTGGSGCVLNQAGGSAAGGAGFGGIVLAWEYA